MLHLVTRTLALGLLVVSALPSCDAPGGGAGGYVTPGGACSQADIDNGVEVCSGSSVLECKADGAGALSWQVKKNCADTSRVCVSGDCRDSTAVADTSPPPSCPDVTGTWKVTLHCVAEMIGTTYAVTQSGCAFMVDNGWTGTVAGNGALTMSGPAGSETWTCTGFVSGTSLSESCQGGTCQVAMERQ